MKKIIVGVALLSARTVLAQAPPPPAPEMAQLKTFDGTFACTGQNPASPLGAAHKTEATVQGKTDLNGHWYIVRYEEKKTAENPTPVMAQLSWRYDATQKKFVGTCMDSFGGSCQGTSTGWQADTLVFTGEATMGAEKIPSRDTFTRKGTTITHKGELQLAGNWTVTDDETCVKK